MREILDKEKLEENIKNSSFLKYFSKRPKALHLYEYEKGELITAPFRILNQLLFIVEGEIKIYGIREDGETYSVSTGRSGTMLGDMEFSGNKKFPYYTEVVERVLCISVPFKENLNDLKEDSVFLNYVIEQLADKLESSSRMELEVKTLEEKVLFYLEEDLEDHMIRNINATVDRLHCSRRQLQRVLKKLCDEDRVEKEKKGCYRLKDDLMHHTHL